MTRRRRQNRQKLLLAVIVFGAGGIVGSIAWLVWYDLTEGHDVLPAQTPDTAIRPGLGSRDIAADIRRVRLVVPSDGFLGMTLARFHRRAGRYPSNLDDLLHRPDDLPPSRWDGPYVSTNGVLNDPWDRPYEYRHPGAHNPGGYDLWSLGPDGRDGTVDDIGNW